LGTEVISLLTKGTFLTELLPHFQERFINKYITGSVYSLLP